MCIGAIDQMILMAEAIGLPPFAMAIVFVIVTLTAAIIMGSGNAPFLAFVELIPNDVYCCSMYCQMMDIDAPQ